MRTDEPRTITHVDVVRAHFAIRMAIIPPTRSARGTKPTTRCGGSRVALRHKRLLRELLRAIRVIDMRERQVCENAEISMVRSATNSTPRSSTAKNWRRPSLDAIANRLKEMEARKVQLQAPWSMLRIEDAT
jgi:hypothetical protein